MIPDWIYISQTAGTSGTTTITVSAGTNYVTTMNIATMNVVNNEMYENVTIAQDGIDMSKQYLTFEIISAGTINWCTSSLEANISIEYSKDYGVSWTTINSYPSTSFNVSAGDVVYFRGDNPYGTVVDKVPSFFSGSTPVFRVFGNIMSLISKTNFDSIYVLDNSHSGWTFFSLFSRCEGLFDATNLILPATTLAPYCYGLLFQSCTTLTGVPKLPATEAAERCYYYMFGDCPNLVQAPKINLKTLAKGCCNSMFRDCTSLEIAPDLTATYLIEGCYSLMFMGCTNLKYVKCTATDGEPIPSTYSQNSDYYCGGWVYDVSSSGTFIKKTGSTIDWESGTSGIPTGWTVQEV